MHIKVGSTSILTLFFVLVAFLVQSQTTSDIGFPYVHNYPKTEFKAGNKNWSITRDQKGIMYYGNSEGLLTYDGEFWQLYKMPQNIIVRAVAADGKGRIYAGGFAEFGYWSYNKSGKFTYTW